MTTIQETFGRDLVLAYANTYPNMTDALMEIIDNPLDYRHGRRLTIEIRVERPSNSRGRISVLDYGGEGMDSDGLSDWIQWGTGHQHASTDIGQYHVGGKLAAVYLAESLEIVCRRSNSQQVYRFKDPHWGSRRSPLTTEAEPLDPADFARSYPRLAQLPASVGFTLVTLDGLKRRRYEQRILYNRLANTYRNLISSEACHITLDGEDVRPLQIPESQTYNGQAVEIQRERLAPGCFVRGRIWVLERERTTSGRGLDIRPGLRTLYNGRLITDGETFGHNLAGRATLQRLIGEVHLLEGFKPTVDKKNWLRDEGNWDALEAFLHQKMQPLVSYLNQIGESRTTSRE